LAIVAFVRGANVGGHRRFKPALLAKELARYGTINVGATGLFVVCNPGSPQKFQAELRRRLPFDAHVVVCDARDVLALESTGAFGEAAEAEEHVRFVSVATEPLGKRTPKLPAGIPSDDEWYVRILDRKGPFFFGVYRRHMKTIGYLGQIDKMLGVPVTTRNWNTIAAVIKVLRATGCC
jgi:uncharacterized protein (DUF1697 family)